MLELAIVLPFMLLLLAGVVEYSRLLRVREIMSVATNVAANRAFRECYDQAEIACPLVPDPNRASNCLSLVANQTILQIDSIFNGTVQLTLSIYGADALGARRLGISQVTLGIPGPTRYDEILIQTNYGDILPQKQMIALSELQIQYQPLLAPILISQAFNPLLYEASVY